MSTRAVINRLFTNGLLIRPPHRLSAIASDGNKQANQAANDPARPKVLRYTGQPNPKDCHALQQRSMSQG
jgi:hypothetical protein